MTEDLFAWKRAEDGMHRSVTHADAVEPSWSDRALELLLKYMDRHNCGPFLIEDVRAWAHPLISPPTDGRAWGAVVKRAARAGHIVRVGYAPANSSNCSPKCLWERGEA